MSLLFCGDIVLPFDTSIDLGNIKPLFANNVAIANLEGCILSDKRDVGKNRWNDKYSVYSCPSILQTIKELNINYVSLCNNHIFDYKVPISNTENILKRNNIKYFGLRNHDILTTELNGKPLFIITFSTCVNGHALNIYNPDKVVEDIKTLKRENDCYVVVYPHWGIERLQYVEPADRDHAHRCIDAGADLIIGHHPHIIQQIEIYKGKTIAYSVGNFIFPQTYYGKKKLIFNNPAILEELIVEWNGQDIIFHTLHFNADTNKISILQTIRDNNLSYIPEGQTSQEYKSFFKSKVNNRTFYITRRKSDSYRSEFFCFLRSKTMRFIRRTMINIGLHNPK